MTIASFLRRGAHAISTALCLFALIVSVGPIGAQADSGPPPVPRELRAAWVATVSNIDWPSRPDLSTWEQQQELLAILNRSVALKLNAVILQIRPGTDALYDSRYEPWSEYLTGRQGRAPEPAWDPLAFAITEAHQRGLELHAWFNPYRARYARPISPAARTHVSNTSAGLVKRYGSYLWMDPGEPSVRRLAIRVVLDVVRRYDIDGVHMDDYFYPYRERDAAGAIIDFPDSASYARYVAGGGRLARDDWRRQNVDLLVSELNRAVHSAKPWVRFGVSPIGVWRPGNPPTATFSFDATQEIYADSRKWLREGWLDYFVPQLYWAIDSPQNYPALLQWWTEQNVKGRHLWVGNGLHRVGDVNIVGANGNRAANWKAEEIVEQVRLTRASRDSMPNGGATGNVFFSMKGLMRDVDSVNAKLGALYAEAALVPASPWLDRVAPKRPSAVVASDSATGEPLLRLTPAAGERTWLWVVQSRRGGEWMTRILPGAARVHRIEGGDSSMPLPDVVYVRAVDRTGNVSVPVKVPVPPGP
jgi:uncharacterized lipoprotein YddW (UPF0748 family)